MSTGTGRRLRALEQAVGLRAECEPMTIEVHFVGPDREVKSVLTFAPDGRQEWKEPER